MHIVYFRNTSQVKLFVAGGFGLMYQHRPWLEAPTKRLVQAELEPCMPALLYLVQWHVPHNVMTRLFQTCQTLWCVPFMGL